MNQIFEFFTKLNGSQKAVIAGGFSILLVFLVFIMVYSKNTKGSNINHNYVIAKDLSKNEIMIAANELETVGVPFSLVGTGENMVLKTSKEYINIAKIKLVASGALKGDHKGWEIFDKSSIGETSFQNKIKYVRAIEGELSRSLEALTYVEKATIKVVLPKDSIFTDKKSNATASAILTLSQGRYLTAKQIKGIKRFVSSAIQDLQPENVQLINQNGELLEDALGAGDDQIFKTQVQYRSKLQAQIEKSILSLLEPVMGSGSVIAKVNIQLDYTSKNTNEETYSPEGTIRSRQSDETITNESNSATNGKASSNKLASSAGGSGKKNNEHIVTTTNYEISKKITQTTNRAFATIKRITAAVTFDERVLKDVKNPQTYIVNIEDLVKDAIGFKETRDDRISVKSFTFANMPLKDETANATVPMVKYYLNEFGPYIKFLVVALLLFIVYKKFATFTPPSVVTSQGASSGLAAGGANNMGAAGGAAQGSAGNGGVGGASGMAEFSAQDDKVGMNNLKVQQERAKQEIQSKVQNQLHTFDNLDAESKVKFETLSEQLTTDVSSNPEAIANMIELLLEDEVGSA
jgi:flagellar M-ring protein FliF